MHTNNTMREMALKFVTFSGCAESAKQENSFVSKKSWTSEEENDRKKKQQQHSNERRGLYAVRTLVYARLFLSMCILSSYFMP